MSRCANALQYNARNCRSELATNDILHGSSFFVVRILRHCDAFVTNFIAAKFRNVNSCISWRRRAADARAGGGLGGERAISCARACAVGIAVMAYGTYFIPLS
ncbi:hypothetical protein EVAR_35221_1 [Eumeta japonica]|uniref:Uncharacterized protein n=1 Tax=Eumeta variegata TaxID=151549 RepID=A0A4C1VEH4_EUMVA|nr:hypothetical protein EVAR_35221_1 [Eumeta japonica]